MATGSFLADANAFGLAALGCASDATSVLNSSYGLAGNFGRYAAPNANPAITTEAQALAANTTARAGVSAAASALVATVQAGGDVPFAAQAVLDALSAALASPADQLRVYNSLAAATAGAGPIATLCRRLTVIAVTQAASAYQPTSYDDAQATLLLATDVLDNEITAAGDAGDDASLLTFQQLRVSIVADLLARGGSLAPLVEQTFPTTLPALVVAAMLYGDATRADELVRRVDPVNPLFMPTDMLVLAS